MAGQFGLWLRLQSKSQGSFTCRKSATWDRRLYFPSEGRHAVDFFFRKIRRPGSNPRSWVPEASMLTTSPPKPLHTTLTTDIHAPRWDSNPQTSKRPQTYALDSVDTGTSQTKFYYVQKIPGIHTSYSGIRVNCIRCDVDNNTLGTNGDILHRTRWIRVHDRVNFKYIVLTSQTWIH
jgi:hypothetical protein